MIAGEHLGILKGLAVSFKDYFYSPEFNYFCSRDASRQDAQLKARHRLKNSRYFSATINGLHVEDAMGMYDAFIRQVGDPFQFRGVWGFKEIRYGWKDDFVFDMLHHLFPAGKFILQVRHPVDQVISTRQVIWWAGSIKRTAQRWVGQTRMFIKYSKAAPEHVRLLRFEDITDPASNAISEVFAWLGLRFGSRQNDVIHNMERVGGRSSLDGSRMMIKQRKTIEKLCLLPEFVSLYRSDDSAASGSRYENCRKK